MIDDVASDDLAGTERTGPTPALAVTTAGRRRGRLVFWRSPGDQPGWARPALLVIAAVAACSYAWRSDAPVNIEIYYAAAARSMSTSFHDFLFGAFDPAGTVTTDKLPGALWVQALAVRLFGAHPWALVLPQVIEGTITVLVLYHAVRRLAGPVAGVLAAAILAISPATVALDRGNVFDTLMIMLVLFAADATVTAIQSQARRRPILAAGLWVGLAFQAKMLEAWLVLPAIAVTYLLAADGTWTQRLRRITAAGAVAGAVSLSWMTVVTLVPAWVRPYTDGSHDNSVFSQVFVYNGFGRLDEASPDQLLDKSVRLGIPQPPPPAWDRLLTDALGRDTAWLLAAALIALVAGLLARRRQARHDPVRAGLVLWGTWLVVLASAFSVTTFINSYYTAALSPAIAALTGTGLALAWQHRERAWTRLSLAAGLLATAGYGLWLLPASGTGLPAWLRPALIAVIVVAACGLAAATWRPQSRRLALACIAACLLAAAIVPATASASVVSTGLGPFETPFEPPSVTADANAFFGAGFAVTATLPRLEAANSGVPYLMATQTSALAAPFIWASGKEVLPIGGFTGTIPEPTLNALQNLIELNDVRTFIQSPTTTDPRLTWIARHCIKVNTPAGATTPLPVSVFYCPGWIFLK